MERLWAPTGQGWDWYSTDKPGERINATAKNRTGLGAYFARRHAHGEKLSILSFQFNGINAGLGGFQFTLTRKADDMAPTAYIGKGDAVCTTVPMTIGTWSMARNPSRR